MQRLMVAALLLLVTATLGGCTGTSGAEARAKTGWSDEGAPKLDTRVVFNNPALMKNVAVDEMTSARSGDIMMAQVTLRSKYADTVNLQYKFEWYDQGGLALYTASATWKPLILYGMETKTIQGVAPDARGREYKFLLRTAE